MNKTPKALVMNFAGRVSDTPINGSLPICKMWGIEFYVDPVGYNVTSGDFFVPAWSVPIAKANETQIELVPSIAKDNFPFTYFAAGRSVRVDAAIELPFLTLPPNVKSNGDHPHMVQLTRSAITSQVVMKPAPKSVTLSKKPKPAQVGASGSPADLSAQAEFKKIALHLFR